MSQWQAADLAQECDVLCRYLVRQPAAPDVVASYLRAHTIGSVASDGTTPAVDQALLSLARMGPRRARLADSYAAVFARSGVVRRKVILLVAILESRGATAAALDTAVPGSRLMWIAELAGHALLAAARLGVAVLLVLPMRLWYASTWASAPQRAPDGTRTECRPTQS
jgi:hypothetical protein